MLKMVDDPLGRQRRDGSAQRPLHARMAHGKAANIEFVEQARRLLARQDVLVALADDDRLGDQRGCIDSLFARQSEARRPHEDAIEPAPIPAIRPARILSACTSSSNRSVSWSCSSKSETQIALADSE